MKFLHVIKKLIARILWASGSSDGDQRTIGDTTSISGKCPWHIPNFRMHVFSQVLTHNSRSNRYLKHQHQRLCRMIESGQQDKATKIMSSIIHRSISYRVCWINKVYTGWYFKVSQQSLKKTLSKLNRIISTGDANLRSYRLYIPKPDGRMRPLGIPSMEWRIYINMWTSFLYMLLDHKIHANQHGFRPNKSTLSAWQMIWSKLKNNNGKKLYIFEFDFENCFSNVSLNDLPKVLIAYGVPVPLVKMIDRINTSIPLNLGSEFINDPEMRGDYKSRGMLYKGGMPQGLPWSPLLTIVVMDFLFKFVNLQEDIILFADDGIIISEDPNALQKLNQDIFKRYGFVLSGKIKNEKPVCGEVKSGEFKFLGLTYNIQRDEILCNGEYASRSKFTDKMLRGLIWKNYAPSSAWSWDISPESWLAWYVWNKEPIINQIRTWLRWLSSRTLGGKYPVLWYGSAPIIIPEMSSIACSWLLQDYKKKKWLSKNQNPFWLKWSDECSLILSRQNTKDEDKFYRRYFDGNKWVQRDYLVRKHLQAKFKLPMEIQNRGKEMRWVFHEWEYRKLKRLRYFG